MRLKYAANVLPIRVMCSGRVSPHFILKAFQEGADGVLVAGCHIGECHYGKGNYITAKRVAVMKEMFQFIGLSPEGNKLAQVVRDFSQEVVQLGPSPFRKFKKTIQWEPAQQPAEALKA